MGWFRKKPTKAQGKKIHTGRLNAKLDRELRAAGVNPDLAYCTECGEWYNVNNRAAVDLHAH